MRARGNYYTCEKLTRVRYFPMLILNDDFAVIGPMVGFGAMNIIHLRNPAVVVPPFTTALARCFVSLLVFEQCTDLFKGFIFHRFYGVEPIRLAERYPAMKQLLSPTLIVNLFLCTTSIAMGLLVAAGELAARDMLN